MFDKSIKYMFIWMMILFVPLRAYGYNHNRGLNIINKLFCISIFPCAVMRKLEDIALQIGMIFSKILPPFRFNIACEQCA
jgi:hypothetical protein